MKEIGSCFSTSCFNQRAWLAYYILMINLIVYLKRLLLLSRKKRGGGVKNVALGYFFPQIPMCTLKILHTNSGTIFFSGMKHSKSAVVLVQYLCINDTELEHLTNKSIHNLIFVFQAR